jgi:hypothetical protein
MPATVELGVREQTTAGPLVAPVRVRQSECRLVPYASYVAREACPP